MIAQYVTSTEIIFFTHGERVTSLLLYRKRRIAIECGECNSITQHFTNELLLFRKEKADESFLC